MWNLVYDDDEMEDEEAVEGDVREGKVAQSNSDSRRGDKLGDERGGG